MPKSSSKSLDIAEVRRLLSTNEAKRQADAERNKFAASAWPGPYNVRLLAEAANDRKNLVQFDTGKVFVIRYDDLRKMVFIRPHDEKIFVPCGYFPYSQLKEAMIDNE